MFARTGRAVLPLSIMPTKPLSGFIDLLGSQKGVVVLALVVCSTILTFKAMMAVQQWMDFNTLIGLGYLGVNAAQRITETLKSKTQPPNGTDSPVPPSP